jgi:hypothetical protein
MRDVFRFEFDAVILPIRQHGGDQSVANARAWIDYNIAGM